MTERFATYDEFFYAAIADKEGKGQQPFDYQRRLAIDDPMPSLVNAPDDWPEEKGRYMRRDFGMFQGGEEVVVEVEFDSHQARYARERSFHPTQDRKELSDGRLRVTFETTEAALEQVARWRWGQRSCGRW